MEWGKVSYSRVKKSCAVLYVSVTLCGIGKMSVSSAFIAQAKLGKSACERGRKMSESAFI